MVQPTSEQTTTEEEVEGQAVPSPTDTSNEDNEIRAISETASAVTPEPKANNDLEDDGPVPLTPTEQADEQLQDGDDSSNDDSSYFADPSNLPSPKSHRKYSASSLSLQRQTSDASLSLSEDSDENQQNKHAVDLQARPLVRMHSYSSLVSDSNDSDLEIPPYTRQQSYHSDAQPTGRRSPVPADNTLTSPQYLWNTAAQQQFPRSVTKMAPSSHSVASYQSNADKMHKGKQNTPHSTATTSNLSTSTQQERTPRKEYKVYWQRWIMLFYMSVLNLLSDWTCYSVAPIALLTEEAFGHINPEQLVVVFLAANGISTALEPILLSRLGLRRTVVLGALLLMIGSIVKSGGMPPIISSSLEKGHGEWRVYLGFFLVGLSQPLYQCTPALLSASWFPERERTLATGVALNANQLGIGFAFIFGTLLVADSDDITNYFGLLSIISTIAFMGTLMQFDDAPPTPPSETAKVMRGDLDVNLSRSVRNFVKSVRNMTSSSFHDESHKTRKDGRRRRSRKKGGSKKHTSRNNVADVAAAPSPINYTARVVACAPSPMMPGSVNNNNPRPQDASSTASAEEDDQDVTSESPYGYGLMPPGAQPYQFYPPYPPTMMTYPPAAQHPPSQVASSSTYEAYYSNPYAYASAAPDANQPPSNTYPYVYPPPAYAYPYWDPRIQQYGYYPPQQAFYPPYPNAYNMYGYQNPGLEHMQSAVSGSMYDGEFYDEGAEPVLTMTPHHLDISIRDDQILLSIRACLRRAGFIHSLVSFTVSGIVINTLSTFMDYLVRLNGAGREYTGIVGGSFQFVIMASSLIVGKVCDHTRKYYSITIGMLVLGAFALAECGVSLDADRGGDLRWSLVLVALLVGPLQPVSTELGVDVVYPLSENTVLVIQQLFSNLLSAAFIPCFKAMKDVGRTHENGEMSDKPEYTFSFYLLIVLHAAATVFFATFNGRYLRYEHELEKMQLEEKRRQLEEAHFPNTYYSPQGYDERQPLMQPIV